MGLYLLIILLLLLGTTKKVIMTPKAQNLALVGGVIGIIVVSVLLLVGNIVYDKIQSSMTGTLSTSATAIQGNITTNTGNAFQLSAVTPLILGAALILTVILGFAAVVSVGRGA
jgi:hypothetical protein